MKSFNCNMAICIGPFKASIPKILDLGLEVLSFGIPLKMGEGIASQVISPDTGGY